MYKIGDFTFEINCPDAKVPDNFRKFEVSEGTPSYHYDIFEMDHIVISEKSFDAHKDEIAIVKKGPFEKRYLYVKGDSVPYAVLEETDESHSLVYFTFNTICEIESDSAFMSLLSLERRLHDLDQYILHSAYMIYKGEGILFTGPSGIGKSTQAGLWEKYRDALVVNGDRSVLSFEDKVLTAAGSPHCGSSLICLNEKRPVKAIVILSQAPENRASRVSFHQGAMRLFREITVNYHNEKFFNDALDFIGRIFESVPVYTLDCNVSEDAVICLEKEIYK